jgi:membrane protease YdiL (CAAX protease family)
VISTNLSVFCLVTIIIVCLLFLLNHYLSVEKLFRWFSHGSHPDRAFLFLAVRIKGFVLFGAVPFLLVAALKGSETAETFITSGTSGDYWYIPVVLFPVISLLAFMFSAKKSVKESFPRADKRKWPAGYWIILVTGWIIYILGYEFLLRGILWLMCLRAFGFWVAIVVNIIIYAIVHLDQGLAMSLGAIPLGILLCIITYLTGSFLFAFMIHAWMAVNYQAFLIFNNPDRSFFPETENKTS